MGAIFTVDWEEWDSAIHPKSTISDGRIHEPTMFLLDILEKYGVKSIFYILGHTKKMNEELYQEVVNRGHAIGWHGYYHIHNLRSHRRMFRSPYWDTTPMPFPPSGGFFFRAMPLNYVKFAVEKSMVMWVHPHDLDESHPEIENPILNWKRHVGLKGAREKLDRLLNEVEWDEPSTH